MKLRGCATAVLFCIATSGADAHDFWIDFGRSWKADPGRPLTAEFLVGHAADREAWGFRRERVVSFRSFGPQDVADLQATLPRSPSPATPTVALDAYGTHVVAFETTPAESVLEAAKFNDYLAEEGLTPALARRKETNAEEKPGREIYARRAKALIQIGDAPTDNVTAPIGQTLEIVPLANPLALAADAPLVVRIDYYGVPLAGASVHLESLTAGLLPEVAKTTDKDGLASFKFPRRGAWKIDVVWTEPIDNHPRADFSTIFSSLTFRY